MKKLVMGGLLAAGLALVLPSSAQAVIITYTYSGPAIQIPDGGGTANQAIFDIPVPDVGTAVFQNMTINFSVEQTWMGDMVANLTHVPSNTSVRIFDRVGKHATSTFGQDQHMLGTYTFSSLVVNPRLVDVAFPLASGAVVPTATVFNPTTNAATYNGTGSAGVPPFSGETLTSFNTTFDGLADISGIWRLSVGDFATPDTGTISSFSITLDVTPVPEPTSMALCGLAIGGVGLRAWKKRKAAKA